MVNEEGGGPGGVPRRRGDRPREHHGLGLVGIDARVRPVPRPQVRSVHTKRLLSNSSRSSTPRKKRCAPRARVGLRRADANGRAAAAARGRRGPRGGDHRARVGARRRHAGAAGRAGKLGIVGARRRGRLDSAAHYEGRLVGGAALTPQKTARSRPRGPPPRPTRYLLEGDCQLSAIGGIRLELLVGDGGHVGRAAHGNLVLSTLEVAVAPREGGDSHKTPPPKLRFATAAADFAQGRSGPRAVARRRRDRCQKETGWALGPRTGSSHVAVFAPASPLATPGDPNYRSPSTRPTAAPTRSPDSGSRSEKRFPTIPARARPPRSPRRRRPSDRSGRGAVARARCVVPRARALARPARAALAELRRRAESTRGSTLVMREAAPPRESHIFQRGSFLSPGERVEPAVPGALPPLAAGDPKNRLGLARWLVDPRIRSRRASR